LFHNFVADIVLVASFHVEHGTLLAHDCSTQDSWQCAIWPMATSVCDN